MVQLIKVDIQSVGSSIRGGKISTSSPTAYVASIIPGTSSCAVRSHLTKDERLLENCIYVQTPSLGGKAVYLTQSLLVEDMSSKIIPSLFKAERSIKVWFSLLPCLPSLSPGDAKALVISVDQAVEVKTDFKTPLKNKIATIGASIYLESFSSKKLVLPDGKLRHPVEQIDVLAPVIYQRLDTLHDNAGRLREGITRLKQGLISDLGKVDCQINLLQDNLEIEPGIAIEGYFQKGVACHKYF